MSYKANPSTSRRIARIAVLALLLITPDAGFAQAPPDLLGGSATAKLAGSEVERLRLYELRSHPINLELPRPPTPSLAAVQETMDGPDRGGFTLLLNLGVGYQQDTGMSQSATGLGGLNLGIGGFLREDLALMFRISGTNVSYTTSTLFGKTEIGQISGVGGPSLQYWPNEQLRLEGGVGYGFWEAGSVREGSLGLILGAGLSIWNSGKHDLFVGVEYAPVFTEDTIQNVGLVFGWQLL